ncbi:ComF family protein [Undibacterium sp. Di24W]|uniref:ComF family protein n=1 Tax=Undibacterium sp. Di24W TaxID=3413033 RepID=UPI003BF0A451
MKKRPYFDRTIVACNYKPPIDHLVLALKFGHRLGLAKAFAKELRNQISYMSQEALPDLICPIPLGAQRLAARGFNQSLEIARPLGNDLGIPVRYNLLLRLRDTLQQSSLHPDARHKNVKNAFTVNPEMCSLIRGRHVAIVDDVITTGTTLNEAAKVLKRFGANKVTNFVFARTIWL